MAHRPASLNQHAGNQAQQQQAQQRPTTVQARACTSNGSLSPAASKMGGKTLGALFEIASHDFKHNNCSFAATGHWQPLALSCRKDRCGAPCAWPVPPLLFISDLGANAPPGGGDRKSVV